MKDYAIDSNIRDRIHNTIFIKGEIFAFVDGFFEGGVNVVGQSFLHHLVVEYKTCEFIRNGIHILYSLKKDSDARVGRRCPKNQKKERRTVAKTVRRRCLYIAGL